MKMVLYYIIECSQYKLVLIERNNLHLNQIGIFVLFNSLVIGNDYVQIIFNNCLYSRFFLIWGNYWIMSHFKDIIHFCDLLDLLSFIMMVIVFS